MRLWACTCACVFECVCVCVSVCVCAQACMFERMCVYVCVIVWGVYVCVWGRVYVILNGCVCIECQRVWVRDANVQYARTRITRSLCNCIRL